jgi:hypothetical protein
MFQDQNPLAAMIPAKVPQKLQNKSGILQLMISQVLVSVPIQVPFNTKMADHVKKTVLM